MTREGRRSRGALFAKRAIDQSARGSFAEGATTSYLCTRARAHSNFPAAHAEPPLIRFVTRVSRIPATTSAVSSANTEARLRVWPNTFPSLSRISSPSRISSLRGSPKNPRVEYFRRHFRGLYAYVTHFRSRVHHARCWRCVFCILKIAISERSLPLSLFLSCRVARFLN